MSARRRWARAALIAAPLLGLIELGAHVVFSRRAPRFEDWDAVKAPVSAMRREGDLVVIAPAWADPAARRALGDELMPLRDAARPDESRYEAAIEVSILGQRAPELEGWREEAREARGGFVLRRLVNPAPARVVFDFVDNLRPPLVDVRGTDPGSGAQGAPRGARPGAPDVEPDVACAWSERAKVEAGGLGRHPTFPAQRFECPGGSFFHVGVTVIADQDFRPRRCIWSHPFKRGEIVTRYRGVPLGRVIRGHAGIDWMTERDRRGAPVTLTVRVDGEVIGAATHEDGDGWEAFEMPLGAHAGAASAEVELAVTTTNYSHRHYCFEADTR
ncbi:MAG: hypothetical protein IT372_24625 [Polyangiaceae bacterium]|nr:hypothetical protein [Polyangiaceae bacterium]